MRTVSNPRQERLKRRSDLARREILDAALRVVLRDGLGRLTLDSVAQECGVTKQGLLYHFQGKDELVFELFLAEWGAAAEAVGAAVALASDGPAALEAIIRVMVERYRGRLDLFRLVMFEVQQYDVGLLTAEQKARLRPLNDVMYAGAAPKLAKGKLPRGSDPRRLAFSAHLAAMGILTMKSLVEHFHDPLRHRDSELVDEMCRVFRAAGAGR